MLALAFLPSLARAGEVATSATIEVSGAIADPSPRALSLDEIRALPRVSFSTLDPWDRQVRTYVGASLLTVLELAGISPEATQVEVFAQNGYRFTIPLQDIRRYKHVLSYEMDGLPYDRHEPSANKGPFAIAIDFEGTGADPELYKHHLAWWMVSIVAS